MCIFSNMKLYTICLKRGGYFCPSESGHIFHTGGDGAFCRFAKEYVNIFVKS